jgi:hypothetical protein
MGWLGKIRPHRRDESWSASLCQTFFSTSMGSQIPLVAEKPLTVSGFRRIKIDTLGDHLNTCTAHSGVKKAHDWSVGQLPVLFHTTHTTKIQQVVRSRGQHCGDVDLVGYLANAVVPVPLVLDLHIDQKYHSDYNNNPPNGISFIPAIASTSVRLHSEFIRLLLLQAHRETDRFFCRYRSSVSAIKLGVIVLSFSPCGVLFDTEVKMRKYSCQGSYFTY